MTYFAQTCWKRTFGYPRTRALGLADTEIREVVSSLMRCQILPLKLEKGAPAVEMRGTISWESDVAEYMDDSDTIVHARAGKLVQRPAKKSRNTTDSICHPDQGKAMRSSSKGLVTRGDIRYFDAVHTRNAENIHRNRSSSKCEIFDYVSIRFGRPFSAGRWLTVVDSSPCAPHAYSPQEACACAPVIDCFGGPFPAPCLVHHPDVFHPVAVMPLSLHPATARPEGTDWVYRRQHEAMLPLQRFLLGQAEK